MTRQILPTKNNIQPGSFLTHPLESLHNDMDRLFERYVPERFANWFSNNGDLGQFALMDITESDKSVDIKVDVPGVDENDIEISLSDNILSIKGKRETSTEEEREGFYRCERSYGSFLRNVELPAEVSEDKIEATVKNGVLCLHMPKSAKAKAKAKKIKIKATK